MMSDPGCICRGNWREIVAKYEPFLDRKFVSERTDQVYTFFGIVHGSDDYYYGMNHVGGGGLVLLSCVGNIESFGYKLLEEE